MTVASFLMKLSAFWGAVRFSQFLTNYDSGQFLDEIERVLGALPGLARSG